MIGLTQVSGNDTQPANQGAEPETDAGELDAFDTAFDEALAQRSDPPADVAGDDDTAPDAKTEAVVTPPGSAEEARTDQTAGGSTPPAETPSKDIWADAPPELKAAHEAALGELQTKHSRTIGQLSASDRELARLRKESGAKPAGEQGGNGSGGNAPENPFEAEDLKALEQEYGEVAGPLLKLTKGLYDRLAKLEAPVAEVVQQRASEAQASEIEVFTSAHPDWEKFVSDERYPEWLTKQPKAVQDAAARAVNVEDGQEAAWLLGQFKASIGAGSAPASKSENETGKPQLQADPKRVRQLEAGRDGGTTTIAVQSGVPDDFDAAMDAIIASKSRRTGTGLNR